MKKLSLLIGLILLGVLGSQAQSIKEVDGVYYRGSTPYTGFYTSVYSNGNTRLEMNLIDGEKDGEVLVYFENGELNEIRSYKRNIMHGSWITYNEHKQKIGLANYQDGKKHGEWKIWDDQGNLLYDMYYRNGEKTGVWKQFDSNGKLISEREF